MNLVLTESAYQSVLDQATKDAPEESCGYLLGPDMEHATENYPMTNTDHSTEHFSFDAKEQFAALKYARNKGLKIVANWHSHPASPSRPSEEDKRLARDPKSIYAILSLAGQYPVFNAFKIEKGIVVESITLN